MPIYLFESERGTIEMWFKADECPREVRQDGTTWYKRLAPVSFIIPDHMRATEDIEKVRAHNERAARELANNPKAEITSSAASREARADLDSRISKHRDLGTKPAVKHDFQ